MNLPLRLAVATALSVTLAIASTGLASGAEPFANTPRPPEAHELTAAAALEIADERRVTGFVNMRALSDAVWAYASSLPPEQWHIPSLARSLEYDPLAAFSFVRDHIRYEPYTGILRGAHGTLAARAGNAFDRSLLLAALLDEMLVEYEFARAALDETAVDAVMTAALAATQRTLDDDPPGARIGTQRLGDRARRDYALLSQAIDGLLVPEGGTRIASPWPHPSTSRCT